MKGPMQMSITTYDAHDLVFIFGRTGFRPLGGGYLGQITLLRRHGFFFSTKMICGGEN
jgi:hypothetical protein